MLYLIDTDTCIYIAHRKLPHVRRRIEPLTSAEVGMSIITYCELMFGAMKSRRRTENIDIISQITTIVPVLPLTPDAAHHYGRIRAELERKGRPIGPNDLLIAAHALALDATLVTNNVREFHRIAGLRVENWA